MTYEPMTMLKEFHDKFVIDRRSGRTPVQEVMPLIDKRRNLINEEFNEVSEALLDYKNWITYSLEGLTKGNSVEDIREHLAKELADLLYVAYGTAEELGIPLQEVFQEVHKSNMGKVWDDGTVHYREDGKVLKPPTYSPPDIKKLL